MLRIYVVPSVTKYSLHTSQQLIPHCGSGSGNSFSIPRGGGWVRTPRRSRKSGRGSDADKVRRWLKQARLVEKSSAEIDGWSWIGDEQVQKSWNKPVKTCLKVIREKNKTFASLSRRWGRERETEVWRWRWKSLWGSKIALRQKLWIWKILHRGLATLSRIQKWRLSDGVCMGCGREKETVEHLLWGCLRLRRRMEWLSLVITGEEFHAASFLDVLDSALRAQKHNLGPLILVGVVSQQCWTERNHMVFDNEKVEVSLQCLLQKARAGEGVLLKQMNAEVRRRMQGRLHEFWRSADQVIGELKRREEVLMEMCGDIEGWTTGVGGLVMRRADSEQEGESDLIPDDSSTSGNNTEDSFSELSGSSQNSDNDNRIYEISVLLESTTLRDGVMEVDRSMGGILLYR
ncbi:hypothetical protein R1sor_015025 [Riccia sorocarpa]|uniref:Reverse transcriptase zinc-binding domain-containing protein n=1 Tax=Riccia sorocarpa TaxID=122646 RepID=A0ABD3HCW7_9MARC